MSTNNVNAQQQQFTSDDNKGYQSKQNVVANIDFPLLENENCVMSSIHCPHSDKDYIVAITVKVNNPYSPDNNPQVFVGEIIIINADDDNSINEIQIKTLGRYALAQPYSRLFPLKTEKSFLINGDGTEVKKVDLESGSVLWSVHVEARNQRFLEDERGIIYSMPDYGEHIYLMDTKTGQVLDKIKAKGVDKSNGGLYGFGYDELNHNLILSTCTFGPHYYYTIYHLSKQMKVVNKTYCSNPPTQFALDLYKKKIYFATASKPIIDCYDSDYKKKVPVNVQNSPLAFFFLKKCKYLAIVTDKKFVVHD